MSDIIAGSPAPTNPTDRLRADILAGLRIAESGSIGDETPEQLLAEYDARKRAEVLANFEALQLGSVDGRVSATCADSNHPTWLRAPEDTRGCPWCRVAYLEAALAVDPDPIAYGPRGYRCGCGKDAHSNLVPCTPDPKDVAAEAAAQRSVDAQFPIVAAFLNEAGESRG